MPFQDLLALFLSGNQGYVPPSTEGPWPEDIERLKEQMSRMGDQYRPLPGRLVAGSMMAGIDPKPYSQYEKESKERAGLVSKEPAEVLREKAEAVRAEKDAAEQSKQAAEAAETERMQKAAYERQLDPYSWLGGEGGADPAEKLQKLRRIREQAGGTGGGGTFSQQADSPELQARLLERDVWAGQQPERDMEFLASAEQARRNPELAMSAAEKLTTMREQRGEQQKRNVQMAIAQRIGQGGIIPFEDAMQARAAGLPIPYEMIGKSREEGAAIFDGYTQQAGEFLSSIDPMEAVGNPQAEKRIRFERYGAMLAQDYKRKIAAKQMTVEQALAEYNSEMSQLALAEGLVNAQSIQQQGAQQLAEVQ